MPVELILRNTSHNPCISIGHDQTILTSKVRARQKAPKTDRGPNRLSALLNHFKRRAKSAGPTSLDVNNKIDDINPPELLLVAAEASSTQANLITSPVNVTGSVFEKYKRFHQVYRNPSATKCDVISEQNQNKALLDMSTSMYTYASVNENNPMSKPRPASFHPILQHHFNDILNQNSSLYHNGVLPYSISQAYHKSCGSENYLEPTKLDNVKNGVLNGCITGNNMAMHDSMYDYPPNLAPYPCPTYVPSSSAFDMQTRSNPKSRLRPSSVDSQRLRKFRGSIKQAFTSSTKMRPLSGIPVSTATNLADPRSCQFAPPSDDNKPSVSAATSLSCYQSWETFKFQNETLVSSSTFDDPRNSLCVMPQSVDNCYKSSSRVKNPLTTSCMSSWSSEGRRNHVRRPPSVDLGLPTSTKRSGHTRNRDNAYDGNIRPATICEVTACHNTPKPSSMAIRSSDCKCSDLAASRGSMKPSIKNAMDSAKALRHIQPSIPSSLEPKRSIPDQLEKPVAPRSIENRFTHLVRKPKCLPVHLMDQEQQKPEQPNIPITTTTNPTTTTTTTTATTTNTTITTNNSGHVASLSGQSSNDCSQIDGSNKINRMDLVSNLKADLYQPAILQPSIDLPKIRSLSTVSTRSGPCSTLGRSNDSASQSRYSVPRLEQPLLALNRENYLTEQHHYQIPNASTTGAEKLSKLDRESIPGCRYGPNRRLLKSGPYSASVYESSDKYAAPILRPPRPPLRTTSLVRGLMLRDSVGLMNNCCKPPRQPSQSESQTTSSRRESALLNSTNASNTDRMADAELNELTAGSDPAWWSHLLPYKPQNLPSSLADRLRQRSSLILSGSSPTAHLSNSSLPTTLPQNCPSSSSFKPFGPPNLMSQSMYEQREHTVSQIKPDMNSSSSTPKANGTWDARSRLPTRPLSVHTDNPRATTFLMPSLSHLSSSIASNKISDSSKSPSTRPSSLSVTPTAQLPVHPSAKPGVPSSQPGIHCDSDLGSPSVLNGLLSESLVKASCPSDSPLLGQYCRLLMLQTPPSTPTADPSSEQSQSAIVPTAFV